MFWRDFVVILYSERYLIRVVWCQHFYSERCLLNQPVVIFVAIAIAIPSTPGALARPKKSSHTKKIIPTASYTIRSRPHALAQSCSSAEGVGCHPNDVRRPCENVGQVDRLGILIKLKINPHSVVECFYVTQGHPDDDTAESCRLPVKY